MPAYPPKRKKLRSTGSRKGFANNSIVKVDDSNELVSNTSEAENDIYIKAEEPTAQFDMNQLMREAAELKAREMAMPSLVKREIANRMTEENLPEDLREKVAIAREVANPKFTPGQLADTLLSQYRSQSAES